MANAQNIDKIFDDLAKKVRNEGILSLSEGRRGGGD